MIWLWYLKQKIFLCPTLVLLEGAPKLCRCVELPSQGALAYGKPIIITDWKGCRDTVEHGVNGYQIQPGNLDELEYYIRKLSDISDKKLYEMGQASRDKAETEFDENLILHNYLQKIDDIGAMKMDETILLQHTVS